MDDAENPLRQNLPMARTPDPCAIVLFGATGDLTARKLVPALHASAMQGGLPAEYEIVGFARRDWSDDFFRKTMRDAMPKAQAWDEFAQHLSFVQGNFDDPAAYQQLKERLEEFDRTRGTRGNRLFYLAVDPQYFEVIVEQLGKAGMIAPPRDESRWTRVVIEKPFGHDLDSALALDREVSQVLHESQTYRIDHYLGKETVQNILALRFGNTIFEPIWNRRHVHSVQITVAEDVGMPGRRGAYYDTSGALRDMVQNHMMQVLCLVAMEPPINLSADAVRNEKVKVCQALPDWTPQQVRENVVRGQYGPGSIQGESVKGYRQEEGVSPDSATETYVAIRLTLDTWRWAGVPFFLRTGKRLPKRASEIAIQFREPPTSLFEPDRESGAAVGNQLVLRIQPNEGASIAMQAKVPGSRRRLQEVRMDFRYGTSFAVPTPEAYQRLLLDALIGDATLYTRIDESRMPGDSSRTSTEVGCSQGGSPEEYAAGTWGPSGADALIEADGARWRRV
jgi:glucose-6-phosphate 1-dehydrogenase